MLVDPWLQFTVNSSRVDSSILKHSQGTGDIRYPLGSLPKSQSHPPLFPASSFATVAPSSVHFSSCLFGLHSDVQPILDAPSCPPLHPSRWSCSLRVFMHQVPHSRASRSYTSACRLAPTLERSPAPAQSSYTPLRQSSVASAHRAIVQKTAVWTGIVRICASDPLVWHPSDLASAADDARIPHHPPSKHGSPTPESCSISSSPLHPSKPELVHLTGRIVLARLRRSTFPVQTSDLVCGYQHRKLRAAASSTYSAHLKLEPGAWNISIPCSWPISLAILFIILRAICFLILRRFCSSA